MSEAFKDRKLVVVAGSSGMGRQTAADVVAGGGSAVIIGRRHDRVDETVMTLGANSKASGITADLTDRDQVTRVQKQLATEHADATLLVNAAGVFRPLPFLDHDGAAFDSYHELNRGIFFLTQTVVRGMVAGGRGGSIVIIGSMWAHRAVGAPLPARTRWPRPGCTPSPTVWPSSSPTVRSARSAGSAPPGTSRRRSPTCSPTTRAGSRVSSSTSTVA